MAQDPKDSGHQEMPEIESGSTGIHPTSSTSMGRTAVVTIVSIALAEIVAMVVIDAVKPPPFWPATLLDATIMVVLILPPLWLLIFRPVSRLIEERREAMRRLEAHARALEALAAKNETLFHAEQTARQNADTLRTASLAIARTLEIDSVFWALLENLKSLVPFDRAKVMLLEGGSRLRVRAIFNPAGKVDFGDKPFDSFDVGKSAAVSEVLTSRCSVCIGDTKAQPGWGGATQPDTERSWLGVPLLVGGEAIGLFTLVKAEPGFFTPENVHVLEALAAPASVAIANARLFSVVHTGKEQLMNVSRKLVAGQESERLRIARELHDEAGQLLASLGLGLRLLERHATSPEVVVARARELRRIADETQEGLHRLASDLRPAALDHIGLVPALGQLAAKLSGAEGPVIQLESIGLDKTRLSPDVDIALYRIAQEALANAVRHAAARRVSLVVERRENRIVMLVEDDGRGFDLGAAPRSERLGLPGMRERAEMLGGTLLVESSPGSGTTIVVEVPSGA
jgi:signal transduction histidine kinase